MQIITSLLNLQARTIDDPVVLKMIKENQSRIRAMFLVHERLYPSGGISGIDLKDYTRFLARELFSFYGQERVNRTAKKIPPKNYFFRVI
jgi:two-component sensor histidine kinase